MFSGSLCHSLIVTIRTTFPSTIVYVIKLLLLPGESASVAVTVMTSLLRLASYHWLVERKLTKRNEQQGIWTIVLSGCEFGRQRIRSSSNKIGRSQNQYSYTYIHTYFIYSYTVKPSVCITITSFITITQFYKIAVWERNRELPYSWSIALLKYPRESDFRRLRGNLFHNSAPR